MQFQTEDGLCHEPSISCSGTCRAWAQPLFSTRDSDKPLPTTPCAACRPSPAILAPNSNSRHQQQGPGCKEGTIPTAKYVLSGRLVCSGDLEPNKVSKRTRIQVDIGSVQLHYPVSIPIEAGFGGFLAGSWWGRRQSRSGTAGSCSERTNQGPCCPGRAVLHRHASGVNGLEPALVTGTRNISSDGRPKAREDEQTKPHRTDGP